MWSALFFVKQVYLTYYVMVKCSKFEDREREAIRNRKYIMVVRMMYIRRKRALMLIEDYNLYGLMVL